MPTISETHDSIQLPLLDTFMDEADIRAVQHDRQEDISQGVFWMADRAQRRTETPLDDEELVRVIAHRVDHYDE